MLRLSALFLLALSACTSPPYSQADYRFDSGVWFDGQAFHPATVYIRGGHLKFSDRLHEAKTIIDLNGGYVVPPYCEGHNHNIGGAIDGVEEIVERYLKDGVFYAMMPGSFALYREAISDKINNPSSVDVSFANNGLTGSGGHPRLLRELLMERYGRYPEFTKETLPDKGYFEADTLEELHEKWALILAEKTDFVKVMLLFSEAYDERKDDPEHYGRRGLNPALLPELIGLAHAANLRVAVHVETEADMVTALRAGADIIAHLTSYDAPVRLSDETIALAAETQAALVTTFTVAKRFAIRTPDRYGEVIAAQAYNLKRLHDAGALLVVGSDSVMDTSRAEADHLVSLGVLDNRAILNMWTRNCARTVFPDRQIGHLADGYEASFIVLDADPLADFENTGAIRLRVKDGTVLNLGE